MKRRDKHNPRVEPHGAPRPDGGAAAAAEVGQASCLSFAAAAATKGNGGAAAAASNAAGGASATPAERQPFLDLLKTTGILLVLFYHCRTEIPFEDGKTISQYPDFFLHALSALGVPLFFFVNGALFFNRPINVKKHYFKMFRLAILGVVWASLTMLFLKFHRGVYYDTPSTIRAILTFEGNWLTHLWFIKALVAIYILAPLVKLAFDHSKTIFQHTFFFVILFTVVLDFFLKISNLAGDALLLQKTVVDYNVFSYHYAFALASFMAGGIFLHYRENISKKRRLRPLAAATVILATLATTLYRVWNCETNGKPFTAVFSEYGSLFTFLGTLGVAILALAWKNSANIPGRLVALIGANTFGIYFLHILIREPVTTLSEKISLPATAATAFLQALLLLALSLLATLLFKRIPILRELVKT